ncbi:MAG TPA: MATE family efflux transporter [Xanthomonadales bacterium]|nr:MATE family efflux transporter [Xanthomonadales bacterium]
MQAFSHRAVWRIAAPMILSNLSVPILGMVDSGVAGHLPGPAYLGAVAVGATIFSVIFMGMNFLRMGTTGITAQAVGAEQPDVIRTALARSVAIALALALILLMAQVPLRSLSLFLIAPEADVMNYAGIYFDVRIWSAPAVLVNFAILGWFLGLQNARVPLVLLLTINITNMVLDLWFVLGLGYQVDGIAAASVIAEYAGLAVGVAFVLRELKKYPGRYVVSEVLNPTQMKRTIAINSNILVRTLCLMFSFAFFTAMGARLGPLELAANALLINLQYFMSYGLDGFALAAEALVGKAKGMGERRYLELAVKRCLQWTLLVAVLFSGAYALTGNMVIAWLTDIEAIRQTAAVFMPWMILSPLVSAWSFLYDGVLIGATWTREMRNSMVFSTFVVYVPAWYFLQDLGNHGLWLAFMIFMAARAVTMFAYYRIRIDRLPSAV